MAAKASTTTQPVTQHLQVSACTRPLRVSSHSYSAPAGHCLHVSAVSVTGIACLIQLLWRTQATACPAHLQCLQHPILHQVLHDLQEALWLFLWGGAHHTCEVLALGARRDAGCRAILTAWAGQLYIGWRVLGQHVGPQRGQQHL